VRNPADFFPALLFFESDWGTYPKAACRLLLAEYLSVPKHIPTRLDDSHTFGLERIQILIS